MLLNFFKNQPNKIHSLKNEYENYLPTNALMSSEKSTNDWVETLQKKMKLTREQVLQFLINH